MQDVLSSLDTHLPLSGHGASASHRQYPLLEPLLVRYGLFLLAFLPAALGWVALDPRTVDGVLVGVKPAKFVLSLSAYALTMGWMTTLVNRNYRNSDLMKSTSWTVIAASASELIWISIQASRGQRSHFIVASGFDATVYAVMGVGALLLVATTLPMSWAISRHPADNVDRDVARSAIIGLVLTFVLGGVSGMYMGGHATHAVGPEDSRLALLGWSRTGGDLRVAHFFGIHAMQAIPLLGALVRHFPRRRAFTWLGAVLYGAATIALFVQAMSGKPLFPASVLVTKSDPVFDGSKLDRFRM